MSNKNLARLNTLEPAATRDELMKCCGASKWAREVAASRPFASNEALFEVSEQAFACLELADWLEAFSHHPQIGDLESLRKKFASTRAWASNEQAGTDSASEAVLQDLAEGNRLYLEKFGFIFIICATGKSAAEMLAALGERLLNDKDIELQNAAEQQKQITRLRLQKLLEAQNGNTPLKS